MLKVALSVVFGAILVGLIGGVSFVVSKAVVHDAMHPGAHALTAAAPGPGLTQVTWGTSTTALGSSSCILLDGGAATYYSDPIIMGGYIGQSESAAAISCTVPAGGAAEDSFTAQFSNDGVLFSVAAGVTAALIDGGVGDAGVSGLVIIPTTPAAYARVQLNHLAAQTVGLCCTSNSVPR